MLTKFSLKMFFKAYNGHIFRPKLRKKVIPNRIIIC